MLTIRDDEKYLQGMTFIDLFAGIGGFRLALESLGAECVYSNEWNKAAQKTYEMNFGEVPEGDITQVNEKSIPDHDILCAGFPCFPTGSLVMTTEGLKPIEKIAIGDMVLTHKNRYRKVLNTGSHVADTVVVKGAGSIGIECTPNHPFLSVPDKNHTSDVSWTRADEMEGRLWLAMSAGEEVLPIDAPDGYESLPELFRSIGNWLADENVDLLAFDDFDSSMTKWLTDNFGQDRHKKLPAWVLGMPKAWREQLFLGYVSVDGGEFSLGTSSQEMVTCMKMLAAGLGYETKVADGRQTYSKVSDPVACADGIWGKVEEISEGRKDVVVYNMEVEDDNSYTVDGIAVHNCQAFSISGKQYGFSDTRGTLFFDVARIIREKKPKIVFMENVKNLVAHDGGNTMKVIANTMEQLGYTFQHAVMDSVDYGTPTARQRCYMVCFRKDLGIDAFEFPVPDHKALKAVKDILITDDKELEGLWVSRPDVVITRSDAQAKSRRPIQLGHVAQGRQGERIYSVNGPAITLSAHGGGAFAKTGGYMVKPGKYRRLHPRECARVMGFPESYKLNPSRGQAYQQFGNSVVVDVLQYIAREFGRVYRDKYPVEQDEQQ